MATRGAQGWWFPSLSKVGAGAIAVPVLSGLLFLGRHACPVSSLWGFYLQKSSRNTSRLLLVCRNVVTDPGRGFCPSGRPGPGLSLATHTAYKTTLTRRNNNYSYHTRICTHICVCTQWRLSWLGRQDGRIP